MIPALHRLRSVALPADWVEQPEFRKGYAGALLNMADQHDLGKRTDVAVALTEKDLQGLPVTASTIADGSVQLLTNQPEVVLGELFRRGVEMSDLEVSGADLEDAFISLTTHKGTA